MRREGSPFKGTWTIALKEAADHITSARMHLVMVLVLLTAIGSAYGAIELLRQNADQDAFLFLKLMTGAREPLPSFASFMGFLIPLVAIALGFDAVNGEFSRRTMSRILAQPIYRDAVLFGKFLGGLLVLGIALMTLWLLLTGLGILLLGLPPSSDALVRGLAYLVATLAYAGVWLALAIALSTIVHAPATSALAALSIWLVVSVFWSITAPLLAQWIAPVDPLVPMSVITQFEIQQAIARLSPGTLYGEMTQLLLDPSARTLGPIFIEQLHGAVIGAPLPTMQSILLVWPQFSGMIAAMLVLFTLAYVVFQRQEVRA
ncbi:MULTISPECIES: ABC transporter permease [Devosia]|uniref:ABC transporter permease n=1 Tax=Devosia TaxID=46913 RepID=UPI000CE9829F|nr:MULTISPECIES: ABC transporter permease subunit [Devosia]AVF03002.1 ABC transporter permease [Devosia sp. I507]